MTECIKCGKSIPDGELFCDRCSKLPVIASLSTGITQKMPAYPAEKKQVPKPAAKKPAVQKQQPKKTEQSYFKPFVVVCVLLAGCLALLIGQQGSLRKEKNKINTDMGKMEQLYADAEVRLLEMDQLQKDLDAANATIEEQNAEIQDLTDQLADSRSSQNQGQYDLTNTKKELEELQTDYDALLEEHEAAEAELEIANGYKDKADFMDRYVVFVPTDGTLYHRYECSDFDRTSFWCYSPKLAERMGFKACPKCN